MTNLILPADNFVEKRFIFLDIDGVLNHHRTRERHRGHIGIDPHCVIWLNRLIEMTGAVVVVSSTWRYSFGYVQTIEQLYQAGFRYTVVGFTPRSKSRYRGDEIQAYCELSGIDGNQIVVLDDDADLKPNNSNAFS